MRLSIWFKIKATIAFYIMAILGLEKYYNKNSPIMYWLEYWADSYERYGGYGDLVNLYYLKKFIQ